MRTSASLVPLPPSPARRPSQNRFLSRFGTARERKIKDLEWRVSRLQATLIQYAEVGRRWTAFRRQITVVLAGVMLALGFMSGVYWRQLQHPVIRLAQSWGLTDKSANSDAAYAAYQARNYRTAFRLARPLAAEGDPRAQSLLGLLYHFGRGATQDHREALRWFRQSADQGDAIAQFYIGVMLSEGQGVPQDQIEAAKWFRRAADLGDAYAQYNLGLVYAKGEAGAPDYVSAHKWFNLAAAHLPASATSHRSAAVKDRDVVARKMTREQIAEAQKRAREWRSRLASE